MEPHPGAGAGPGSSLRTLVIPRASGVPPRPSTANAAPRHGNGSVDARQLLAARALGAMTVDPVTCGYADGDAARPRTADAGFNCRVDVNHGLWGFCPKSVVYAFDCGLAAACVDRGSCSRGCGNMDASSLTTFTCTGDAPFCSTALLDSGPDQTYSYIACAAKPVTATLLAAPTEKASSAPTIRPSSDPPRTPSPTTTPAPASRPSGVATQPSSSSPAAAASSNATGAIVGGVVGGIALICLTVLAVVWVMRRGRGRSRAREHSQAFEAAAAAAAADGHGTATYCYGPGELPGAVLEPPASKNHPYVASACPQTPPSVAEMGAFHGQSSPAELYGHPR